MSTDDKYCIRLEKCECGDPLAHPDLSYEEQEAGYRDFDGNKVYRKAVLIESIPKNTVNAHFSHGATNVKRIVRFESFMCNPDGAVSQGSQAAYNSHYVRVIIGPEGISLDTSNHGWNTHKLWVIIDYTCTDR